MTEHSQPHVEALAAQLHATDCLLFLPAETLWAADHHNRDQAKARRILTGLVVDDGLVLTTVRQSTCPLCAGQPLHLDLTTTDHDPGETS